jgi:transposase
MECRTVLTRQPRRKQVTLFRLQPCLIGMEATAGAHYWARELTALGHEVKLMAPQFVKPYVKAVCTDHFMICPSSWDKV